MALAMAQHGGMGIIHRMQSVEDQAIAVSDAYELTSMLKMRAHVGAAVGIGDDMMRRVDACVNAGASVICIDVAHGHDLRVLAATERILKSTDVDINLIVGNIATVKAADDIWYVLEERDTERVILKVGIGGGSMCTTRIQTGCGIPTFQSVVDIAENYPVIADGGIRTSGDIVKCLAAHARAVMVGGLIAGTDEVPAEDHDLFVNGVPKKVYRGAASEAAKNNFYGKADYIEGAETLVDAKGPVSGVLKQLGDGMRSGLSYCGAKSPAHLASVADFVEITPAGMIESRPHGVR
jgi:IMP dehydrogenase